MLLWACTALAYVLPQAPTLRTPLPQSPARAGAPAVMQAKPEAVRLSLAKPLGLVLEERPGGAGGVYVESLVDGGSARVLGTIESNRADYGAGVCALSGGSLVLDGDAVVRENRAVAESSLSIRLRTLTAKSARPRSSPRTRSRTRVMAISFN